MDHVEIELVNEQADASALDAATRSLRDDLERLDACTVTQPMIAPRSPRRASIRPCSGSCCWRPWDRAVAVTVLSLLRDWLLRNRGFNLRVKRDGTEFELEGSGPRQLQNLLAQVRPLLVAARETPDTASGP